MMWLLEHETLFAGKRTWLRPGSQYLFGRTSAKTGQAEDGKTIGIDNKSVSRQHMMLKVHEVPAGDGTKLHTRTPVEITDLSCKRTIVDGERTLKSTKEEGTITKYDTMVLTGANHTITLALNFPEFKISWHPAVFTFASRDGRPRAPQLHALDIKTTTDVVHDQTTHVITVKRNLPRVLLGLCAATYIVTPDYIDAVIAAATPQNTDPDHYQGSKLEEDFDGWWPKEKGYITPSSQEPVKRPEQMLMPDPRRSEVFSGLTFVFLNESQYETLQEVVAAGGGKALLYDLRFGETTVDEYVEYVMSVAGEKRRRRALERLPVVTIRLSNYPGGMEEWAMNFVIGVDQALNQRSIQQNEFLDAILTVDTSSLMRPPAEIEVGSSMPESTERNVPRGRMTASQSAALSEVQEPTPTPAEEPGKVIPRKRVRRGITQSRFTGFDDYEPPSKVRKTQDQSMEDVKMSMATQIGPTQDSQQLPSQGPPSAQIPRRLASPANDSVEEIDDDELFPAAAELKRRRAATRGVSASVEPEASVPTPTKSKTKAADILKNLQRTEKKTKEVDVREQARLRVQQEEEKRRADEEKLREALQGVDISDIRGLVQVEEMEILPRQRRTAQRSSAPTERWNDEWNGRKNFKKFRRRGAERGPERPQRTIVALEEARPKKGFGPGDAFFLKDTGTAPSTRRTQEVSREDRRRTARTQESESEAEHGFTMRKRTQEPDVIHVEDSLMDDGEGVPDSSATLRNRSQGVAETQVTETQTQTQRKRPPLTVAAGQPPSKKARRRRDDDSDAEETGFRLRRRR